MIERIFEELRLLGAVTNTEQFSKDWLGRESSYLRCLRSKRRLASPGSLTTCAIRLKRTGNALVRSPMVAVAEKGQKMVALADRCMAEAIILCDKD